MAQVGSGGFITVTPILPGKPILVDQKRWERVVDKALRETQNYQMRLLGMIIQSWNNKPKLVKTGPTISGGSKTTEAYIDSKIAWWLDRGTSKRYMSLSRKPKWKSKTRVGIYPSGPGAGKTMGITGKVYPGIRARGWSKRLARDSEAKLAVEIFRNLPRTA